MLCVFCVVHSGLGLFRHKNLLTDCPLAWSRDARQSVQSEQNISAVKVQKGKVKGRDVYCNKYVIGAQKLAHVTHQNVSNHQNSVCHESIYIWKGICRNRCTVENDDADLHVPQGVDLEGVPPPHSTVWHQEWP